MAVPKLINFNNLKRDPEKPVTLYRANNHFGNKGTRMNIIYNENRGTYFTLNSAKLTAYFKRSRLKGMGFTRKNGVPAPQLFDMRNATTVRWIKDHFPEGSDERVAIDTAFPVSTNGTVRRISNTDTKHLDDIALAAIGRIAPIAGAVGYYSGEQKNANDPDVVTFHEEVGLTPSGFRLFSITEHVPRNVSMEVSGKKRPGGGGGGGAGGGKILNFMGGSRRKTLRKRK